MIWYTNKNNFICCLTLFLLASISLFTPDFILEIFESTKPTPFGQNLSLGFSWVALLVYPPPARFLGVTWFLQVKKSIENHSFWVKKSKKAIIMRRAIRGYHHYLLCSFLWRFIVKNISDQNIPDHYRSENLDQQAQDQISTKSSKHGPVAFSEMEI